MSVGGEAREPAFVTVEHLVRHRLMAALGGMWGSVEATAPTVGFVIIWLTTGQLTTSLIVAATIAVLAGAVRLIRGGTDRTNLRYVATGLAGVGIAAFFALRTGRAQDAFLPGILLSAGYVVGMLASILVRWPAIGFIVGAADPMARVDPLAWHRHPEVVRVSARLTWVLLGDHALRVAVMLPLYLAGAVGWLGIAKIALGWPLWAVVVAVMGGLLMRGHTPYVPLPDQQMPIAEDASPAAATPRLDQPLTTSADGESADRG
ncbi:MAG: DUF3159 domain-containing protein [Nostocoides sp.]